VQPRQWTNQRQPQTLQIAVFLLYANAVLSVIFAISGLGLLFGIAGAVAAYQIANERRWGYRLGVGVAGLRMGYLLLIILVNLTDLTNIFFAVNLIFPAALFIALVHPMSRDYQRIWFN
jgi:hypothetical protein